MLDQVRQRRKYDQSKATKNLGLNFKKVLQVAANPAPSAALSIVHCSYIVAMTCFALGGTISGLCGSSVDDFLLG